MTSIPRPSKEAVEAVVGGGLAVITGAARGIGFATASLLAQHGARVALVDINETELQNSCSIIGPKASYYICDVSIWEQQVALFDKITSTLGPISLLVCNAAINPELAILANASDPEKQAAVSSQVDYNYLADELDKETGYLKRPPTRLFEINLNSVIFGLKLGINHMKKNGGGRILVTASAVSYVAYSSQPLYSASKHAVLGLVRSTAMIEEVTKAGISISWVAPWLTITSMVDGLQVASSPTSMKSSPVDVAWAIVAGAAAEDRNGKGYWIQGQNITEVEGDYWDVAGRLIDPANIV